MPVMFPYLNLNNSVFYYVYDLFLLFFFFYLWWLYFGFTALFKKSYKDLGDEKHKESKDHHHEINIE